MKFGFIEWRRNVWRQHGYAKRWAFPALDSMPGLDAGRANAPEPTRLSCR